MSTTPETGFLVLADLTGYTAYLAGSELEHAPTIAGDLLETVVGRLEPPLRLAKFEGDAAFLFAEEGRADASMLVDAIEACYLAFRRRLRSIEQATACDCASCRLAPRLDLKFFVHHGSYVRSRIAGRDELAGSDVIMAHRLLKGTTASSRRDGFAAFTNAAIERLGLDATALGLVATNEVVEHLGSITTYALDLEARWQAETARRRLDPGIGPVIVDFDAIVAIDPANAWARLTSPAMRASWEGPVSFEEIAPPGGRRSVGTVTQCVTGRLATIEEIVDWQPFDHVGWRISVPELGLVVATADLDVVGAGTHVRVFWQAQSDEPRSPDVVTAIVSDRAAAFDRFVDLTGNDVPVMEGRGPA
jgi:hypothetical protein